MFSSINYETDITAGNECSISFPKV